MASSRGSGLRLPMRGSFFVETAVAVTSEGLPDEKLLELVGCHEPGRSKLILESYSAKNLPLKCTARMTGTVARIGTDTGAYRGTARSGSAVRRSMRARRRI